MNARHTSCCIGIVDEGNAQDWPEIKQAEYKGDTLRHAGINIPPLWGDFKGRLMHLKKK